jgi:hypothetical protein
MSSSELVSGRAWAEVYLTVSAARVWQVVGSFADAAWIPGTARCELEDRAVYGTRRITTENGVVIRERLLSHDENARTFTYTIVEAPMPLEDYESRVQVDENGEGSRVRWSATWQAPAGAAGGIEQGLGALFRAALDGLKSRLD